MNLTGTPWLATAGAGDVLAGLAGSFLAAGAHPRDAGSLAAFVHGYAEARRALHQRYRRLLLDEFQDTDPIQIELAVRIAAGAEASQESWRDVVVPEGRLFVVGDAKQSIYRFRRASIATYLEAQDHLGARAHLTTNFRTVAPILDWVNAVFGTLIEEAPAAQPQYEALRSHRAAEGVGPAVTVLGAEAHTGLPPASAAISKVARTSSRSAVSMALATGSTSDDAVIGQAGPGARPTGTRASATRRGARRIPARAT